MTKESTELASPVASTDLEVPSFPALIKLAIEHGSAVEAIERLAALQERAQDRAARIEFFMALRSFRAACPPLHKSGEAKITTRGGGSYTYTYAPLDEIAQTVRPGLSENGLDYAWTTEPSDHAGTLIVVCILRHVDGHEERAEFPVPTETSAAMSGAQKTGAALTYGQRMSLVSVLGITASDDVDGAEGVEPITPDQIKELNELVESSGADYPKFLAYMEIDNIGEITQGNFQDAQSALVRKATR